MSDKNKDNFNSIVNSVKKASASPSNNSNAIISDKINSKNTSGLQNLNESGLRSTNFSLDEKK